jgi:hypothetical protein
MIGADCTCVVGSIQDKKITEEYGVRAEPPEDKPWQMRNFVIFYRSNRSSRKHLTIFQDPRKFARPDGLLRGLRPLGLAHARLALRAINFAGRRSCRTADSLVRSRTDDFIGS